MGRFSKLPYLGMKVGHWPKLEKLHMFLPQGVEIELVVALRQRFPRYGPIFFKISIFGHETCPFAEVLGVAHTLSFHRSGSKWSLFSLYRQWFPRYGTIFKIAMFGHETWPLTKVPEVTHVFSFYPVG